MPMTDDIKARLLKIKAVAMDIDGVLTDGGLIPLSDGDLLRRFDAKDSFAIRAAAGKGYATGIMSGGDTEALHLRCLSLKIKEENIHLGCRGKLKHLMSFCETNGVEPSEVMYFGDDIPDIPVLRACGLGIAPADAVDEVKEAADYVSEYPGGHRCVRNAIETMMKAQGTWVYDESCYDKIY